MMRRDCFGNFRDGFDGKSEWHIMYLINETIPVAVTL
jgi:hypothetical protein